MRFPMSSAATRAVALFCLATTGALGFTASMSAEVRVSVAFPDATMRAFREGPVSADQLRKNGLTIRVDGEEEVRLVVFVYAIKQGQLGRPWTSQPLPSVSGGRTITATNWLSPNESLPAETFGREEQFRPKEPFQSGDTFLSADSVGIFLREAGMSQDWSGLVIAVSSTDGRRASDVMTNPLFARAQPRLE